MGPLLAIVWAQWRVSANYLRRANKAGVAVKWITSLIWYGSWLFTAWGVGMIVSGRLPVSAMERMLPAVFFFLFFFWQLFPIVMASQGAFIDMRRLLVYPIPRSHLFWLEVLLRISTGLEMLLICLGLGIGFALNRNMPWWSILVVAAYAVLNLLLAAALKSGLAILFGKKGVREAAMVLFLAMVVGPQFWVSKLDTDPAGSLSTLREIGRLFQAVPWVSAARLSTGWSPAALASLIGWIAIAYVAARMLFERTLASVDSGGAPAAAKERPKDRPWLDRLARWPSKILLDPLAILVEKDLRTLARSSRFRLIFLMSSTFGAALWLPQAMRGEGGWIAGNYITMAAMYGMLVLGEVIYWNIFGFERAGAQHWFVAPLPFRQVLRAKNVVAAIVTVLAVATLALFAALTPVRPHISQVADAAMAGAVCLTFILGAGNLTSVYMPKPIDGEQTWRNQSSKTQFLLLFVYPFLFVPVTLAYLARWATQNYWAFHGVLGAVLLAAWCFYSVATETAAEVAEQRKERIVAALTQKEAA